MVGLRGVGLCVAQQHLLWLCIALAMTCPANAAVTPTGNVFTLGGDPADDGPVLPTAGDLIVPDTDSIILSPQSSLLIDGGSFVRSGDIFGQFGGDVTVTITGAGTLVETVRIDATRFVFASTGTLSILDGAVYDSSTSTTGCATPFCGVNIGRFAGSDATLVVDGPGSELRVAGGAFSVAIADFSGVAGNSVGTVTVSNGGVINAEAAGWSQGDQTGQGLISEAFVTITDPGSQINIETNAFLSNQFGSGAESTLVVQNQGEFNVGGPLIVSRGVATLANIDVLTGGRLTANVFITSEGVGSTTSILLDGAGSTFDIADEFVLGQLGTASLNVTGGSAIAIGGGAPGSLLGSGLIVGTTGGTGSVLVDASSITMTPNTDLMDVRFSIGLFGTGDVVLQNGANILLQDLSGQAGVFGDGVTVGQSQGAAAGTGSLTVQGTGTTLTVDSNDIGFLIAGLSQDGVATATGTVDVLSGAVVNITGRGGASGITLGRGANSQGIMNVAGAGTILNVVGAPGAILVAGDFGGAIGDGDAQLTVTDQAAISISGTTPGQGFLNVGLGTGNGIVIVDDSGSIDVDGQINISLPTAQNSSQTGQVTVDGSGVITTLDTVIGNQGLLGGSGTFVSDTLSVQTGGSLQLDNVDAISAIFVDGGDFDLGATDLIFGSFAAQLMDVNSGGTVNVIGDASFGGSGGGADVTVSDFGSLIAVGGDVFIADSLSLNSQGRLTAGGDVTIELGGILGGDGGILTAANTFINVGGRLGPGNSPGTLDIVGDVFLNGGVLEFEIAGSQPGQFDVLNVDGDLNLNAGTVSVTLLNNFNPSGQNFDVINVTGNLVQDPSVAFLATGPGPDFEFSVRNVGGLTIGSFDFLAIDIAATANLSRKQLSLASYMDDLCPRVETLADPSAAELDLDNRCGSLRTAANSNAQVATALDAISPDDIIAGFNTLIRFTGIQHGNLSRRLNGLRNGASRVDLTGLNIETEDVKISGEDLQSALAELVDDRFDRWGFFSDGRINFGDRDASDRVPGFDFDTISLTFGTDYRLSKNTFLGAAIGYNEINADFDAGGGVLIKAYTVSLLGTYFRGESFYVDALLSYGMSNVDTAREIRYADAGGLISRKAKGDTDGEQFAAGVGTGLDFNSGRWVYGVHTGANYSDVLIDRFDETGALGLNMAIPETATRSFTGNAGVHLSYTTTPSWGVLIPYARVDYVHEFKNENEFEKVRFVNDRFGSMTPNSTEPARVETGGADANYIVWSVGLHAQFIRGVAGFIDYRGTASLADLDVSEVTVGLRYEKSF